jgi:sulfide:quinone oxidoreductase
MFHWTNFALFSLAILGACGTTRPQEEALPPTLETTEGYVALAPGIAAAGQPDIETLESLDSMGYRTVVNLRMASEDPSPIDEGTTIRDEGLEYVHIPMSGGQFTLEQAQALGDVLSDPAKRPVLVHCRSGRRVHVLYALYQITENGVPVDVAIQAAQPYGVQGPLEERIRQLAAEQASR